MFPGMNPRQMQQALKRMGIQQQEVEATEVIIKCPDKEIVISNPSVSKVNMMGNMTFQVMGQAQERPLATEIKEEDIKTVAEQAAVSEEEARNALEKSKGDLAKAILYLKDSE
jgi:nascent polypeptide-associated complex subunit alpha